MNSLIASIFEMNQYSEVKDVGGDTITFYKHKLDKVSNYFILKFIDCREFEDNKDQVLDAMVQLEKDYTGGSENESIPLKRQIINSLNDIKEASQIDKNTSAIYVMLFENIDNLNNYRNAVYSIEESPNYFKRYVLPYTKTQLDQLKKAIEQYRDRPINDALCQIVDDPESYFKLLYSKALDSTYGLVIRMFSKLPFLKYDFKVELAPEPIEKQLEQRISDELRKYHKSLSNNEMTMEEILSLEDDFTLDEEAIDIELQKLLKGVKQ